MSSALRAWSSPAAAAQFRFRLASRLALASWRSTALRRPFAQVLFGSLRSCCCALETRDVTEGALAAGRASAAPVNSSTMTPKPNAAMSRRWDMTRC